MLRKVVIISPLIVIIKEESTKKSTKKYRKEERKERRKKMGAKSEKMDE